MVDFNTLISSSIDTIMHLLEPTVVEVVGSEATLDLSLEAKQYPHYKQCFAKPMRKLLRSLQNVSC